MDKIMGINFREVRDIRKKPLMLLTNYFFMHEEMLFENIKRICIERYIIDSWDV